MVFTKQAPFTKKVTDLPDKPSPTYTATDIKTHFQQPSDELSATVNKLVDDLHAATAAQNIGANDGTTPTTIQGILDNFKLDISDLFGNKTDKAGDHPGTWQGYKPTQTDPGIQSVVDDHTAQLADIAINVKNKGAVLDGVTDCTQYLKNAHDALPAEGGKILIPPGRMKLTSAVTFSKTVILEGTSVAHLVGTTGSVILMESSGELIFTGSSSGVRDLMVDGVAGNTGNGITMLNARPWLDNVTVVNQGGHGVQIGHPTDTTVNVNSGYLANIRVKENVGDGLRILHADSVSPNANAIVINKIDCSYNDGNGITIINCFDNQFVGVHSEGNAGYGIQLTNASSHVFLKPYLEFNTLGELKGDIDSKYNYVYGHRRDSNIFLFVFDSPDNFVQGRSTGKGLFPVSNKQIASVIGVSNESISGRWEMEQDGANRDLIVSLKGTSSTGNVKFKHDTGGLVTHQIDQFQVGGGTVAKKHISVGATLSFTSIAANSAIERTITVTGAALYDSVFISPNGLPEAGLVWSACVSAADTVTLRIANITTASITPAQRAWKVDLWKH
jgi:hypothetical protein